MLQLVHGLYSGSEAKGLAVDGKGRLPASGRNNLLTAVQVKAEAQFQALSRAIRASGITVLSIGGVRLLQALQGLLRRHPLAGLIPE